MMIKLNIKHPTYEVKVPNFNKSLFVRGLSFKTKSALSSNVASQASQFALLFNVMWDAVQNKDEYQNDFEYFLKHTDWDDLAAIGVGILNITHKIEKDNISLTFTCQEPDAKSESGECGKKYKASFKYSNLISKLNLNTEIPDLYDRTSTYVDEVQGVEIHCRFESLYYDSAILRIIDALKEEGCKAWKEFKFTDVVKNTIISALLHGSKIYKISEIANEENPTPNAIELIYDLNDPNCLKTAIEFGSTLIELSYIDSDALDKLVNPNESGLECMAEIQCPKCKKASPFDLKEWIINSFFP